MSAILSEYDTVFDVRRFPPGHAIQACEGVERRARPLGFAALIRLIVVAKTAAMHYIERRARRQLQRTVRGDGRTRGIDARVDANFGQIHDTLKREAATYGDTPDGKLAGELMEVLFPKGLAGTTQIPYEEQVALNEYQVALVREKYPDAPARLGFERQLGRIEALQPDYRSSLDLPEQVSAIELGEAYADLQVKLLRVVAGIMVIEDDETRTQLMEPVHAQAQRLAAAYAARRRTRGASDDAPLAEGAPLAEDVPPEELDLDPEVRAALDAAAAAEAQVQAEAEAPAGASSDTPEADPPTLVAIPALGRD